MNPKKEQLEWYVCVHVCTYVRVCALCECVYVYLCMYVSIPVHVCCSTYIYNIMSGEFETRIRKCQLFIVIVIDYIIIGFPIKNV